MRPMPVIARELLTSLSLLWLSAFALGVYVGTRL